MEKVNNLEIIFVDDKFDLYNIKEYGKLYISKTHFALLCPCKTHKVDIPIVLSYQNDVQPNWTLINNNNSITIRPSILTQPCNSHYYITDNKIEWL